MRALEFDFETRTYRELAASEAVAGEARPGRYVWYDLDLNADPEGAEAILEAAGLNGTRLAATLVTIRPPLKRIYTDGIHIVVNAPVVDRGDLLLTGVGLALGEGFCATIRRGPVEFVEEAWQGCPDDFRSFARTPGFLIYEFWDHLVASYREAAESLGDRVRQTQDTAFGEEGDAIFNRVAALSRELLMLRRTMVAARETLTVMVTRRSALVPKSTRPFLSALVGALDRLLADLSVEREILSETLNLYIGVVGHRTNQVVNRLTAISFIFLPLSFLTSMYGMNFYMPEVHLRYGYALFLGAVATIVVSILTYMRRRKWL